MEIRITKEQILTIACAFGVGTATGVFAHKYHVMKNTPEETIRKLEAATAEKKAAEKSYSEKYSEYSAAYSKLVSIKKEYQDEIRPELEAKIRKEFQDYIGKADETYAKAKHENELASLKLELIKEYKRKHSDSSTDGIRFDISI